MPEPYVVPGGRFREIYYWDSYFTMLGLKADGQDRLIAGMLDDFDSLVARYGFVPNGTRTYYLGRSQPPFLALMADLDPRHDAETAARHLAALRAEHAFWMKGAAAARRTGAAARVVRMPDGSLLNRYWDDAPGPRDESWAEDVATARTSGRPAAEVYKDLRAGAESGWDYSSRWLADPARLDTIRTTQIVPVDLNSLLWAQEQAIARRCAQRATGLRRRFRRAGRRAGPRHPALAVAAGRRPLCRLGPRAAGTHPARFGRLALSLFVGLATPAQASAVARLVSKQLLAPGGLRTTPLRTGQQWDDPNGWAPLQWIAHQGLARYGQADLAATIARRWLATVAAAYDETGKMLEKYDVETHAPGGGGEYPLQDGFGWTNGVTRAFLEKYGG
jgi:alpha,alpha-trehalase